MIDINELRTAVEVAGLNAISMQEVLELLDRLEAAESVLKDFGTTAQEVECWLERYRCLEREAEALRASIEAMERQEPVGTLHDDGCFVWSTPRPYESNYAGWKMKLYLAPGAKGE